MKKYIFLLLLALPCTTWAQIQITGDFDGDGEKEVLTETTETDTTGREGSDGEALMTTFFTFSKKSIPILKFENCIEAPVHNLGDLNDDGKDEIGMLFIGATSNWHSYSVYTLKKGKWVKLIKPFTMKVDYYEEHPIIPVKKVGKKRLKIYYFDERDWQNNIERYRTRIVKIK